MFARVCSLRPTSVSMHTNATPCPTKYCQAMLLQVELQEVRADAKESAASASNDLRAEREKSEAERENSKAERDQAEARLNDSAQTKQDQDDSIRRYRCMQQRLTTLAGTAWVLF